uniref:Uncharacterized protein n=1 Tax=Prasinoderma coloniale TaxID=156133 RepID=A0A7R9U0D2_9VIRI|eukprot:PRCOL_00004972-RA
MATEGAVPVWADTGEAVRPAGSGGNGGGKSGESGGDGEGGAGAAGLAADATRRLRGVLEGGSLATRLLVGVLVVGYLVSRLVGERADLFFALVCRKTLPRIWNVATAGIYETSLPSLALSSTALLVSSRLLEPQWGTKEFFAFMACINACVGAATFASLYALYAITQDLYYLNARVSGFYGVTAALLVAARQLMPNELPVPALPFLRAKHLCQLYLVSAAVLTVASGAKHHHMGMCLFVVYGTWFAWIYLRFYQRRAADLEAGDQSEEMSFEAFWPEPCQPLCANLGSVCFKWCCVRPADVVARAQQRGGSEAEAIAAAAARRDPTLPPAQQESERRKREAHTQRALKLLEERLRASNAAADAVDASAGDDEGAAPSGESNV